jgi:predicted DNA-binding transcriptional regulator AlpA
MRERNTQDHQMAPAALLDTVQAARFLGLGERTLQNWRVRGEGPAFLRAGRSVRYSPEDLERWLAARRFRSTSEADCHAARNARRSSKRSKPSWNVAARCSGMRHRMP